LVEPVNGTLPADWQVGIGQPTPEFIAETLDWLEEMLGSLDIPFFDPMQTVQAMWREQNQTTITSTNNIGLFMERHNTEMEAMTLSYLPGFDDAVFDDRVWDDLPTDAPLPIVVSTDFLQTRNIPLDTDLILVINPFGMHGSERYRAVEIVGTHNGGNFFIMPYWVKPFFAASYRYTAVRFTIDAAYNPMLAETVLAMRMGVNPRHLPEGTQIFVDDTELRTVVFAMSQLLLFMTLLQRVVIILALCIGGLVAWLLVMTHAKNVAILRTLGMGKWGAAGILCGEQWVIYVTAVVLGGIILLIFGGYVPSVLLAAGIYLSGATVGMTVGAMLCLRYTPLDLLQVRE